ncbi:putative zinc-binding metallopeptidase [Burkholderiaceae bacterium UC74_6]
MRRLHCSRCGQRVFFENTRCDACDAVLGFVPDELAMVSFEAVDDDDWRRLGPAGAAQRPCANYVGERVCNWTVPVGSASTLCLCCGTTQLRPDLDRPETRTRWAALEQAKRRLFYGLRVLGLPTDGLSFRFVDGEGSSEPVLTGHDHGVITINMAEADDASREQMRARMNEPYRTLLGHFRHESGHHFWDRLIAPTPWLDEYRLLFGDERLDYGQALERHYAEPVADWSQSFISAYASSHPWEDWAECWAHYLHILDGLETAAAWGFRLEGGVAPCPLDHLQSLAPALIKQWLPVSQFVNAMDRSLGMADSYPFTVPTAVVEKLEFVHRVVASSRL